MIKTVGIFARDKKSLGTSLVAQNQTRYFSTVGGDVTRSRPQRFLDLNQSSNMEQVKNYFHLESAF